MIRKVCSTLYEVRLGSPLPKGSVKAVPNNRPGNLHGRRAGCKPVRRRPGASAGKGDYRDEVPKWDRKGQILDQKGVECVAASVIEGRVGIFLQMAVFLKDVLQRFVQLILP